jgi:RHS repeat-associated protein
MNQQTLASTCRSRHFCSKIPAHARVYPSRTRNARICTAHATGLNSDSKNDRIITRSTIAGTTTNTATYNINPLGQRVRKVTPSSVTGTRRFIYDEAGRLAGEYDASGKLIQETVWFGDLPIATLRPKAGSTTTPIAIDVFYVHADHLGTPRVITRPSDNKTVWQWDSTEAFGNTLPNENPSALGNFTYNLRHPGQQFDKETGTFYNYFRDYDPSLGRYVQSDPIGLFAGSNTYGYVFANPLRLFDPLGLYGSVYRNGNAFSDIPPRYGPCLEANWIGGYIFGWIPCRPKPRPTGSDGECTLSSSGSSSANSGSSGDGSGPSGAGDPSGSGPYRRGGGYGPAGSGGPNGSGGACPEFCV